MIVSVETVLEVLRECPEAKYALEKLFPDLKKQKHSEYCTEAYFTEHTGYGKGVWGHSNECLLTKDFLLGHQFTKITFEWEE